MHDQDRRIARRERINEIYRSIWNPVPGPGEGFPFVPADHIHQMRAWLKRGGDPHRCPVVVLMAREGLQSAAWEYERLLREEVEDSPDHSRKVVEPGPEFSPSQTGE